MYLSDAYFIRTFAQTGRLGDLGSRRLLRARLVHARITPGLGDLGKFRIKKPKILKQVAKVAKTAAKVATAPIRSGTLVAIRAAGMRSTGFEKAMGVTDKERAMIERAAPIARSAAAVIGGGLIAKAALPALSKLAPVAMNFLNRKPVAAAPAEATAEATEPVQAQAAATIPHVEAPVESFIKNARAAIIDTGKNLVVQKAKAYLARQTLKLLEKSGASPEAIARAEENVRRADGDVTATQKEANRNGDVQEASMLPDLKRQVFGVPIWAIAGTGVLLLFLFSGRNHR